MTQIPENAEAEIVNEKGLHARAAAMFVKVAGQFDADISVERNGQSVSGISIMGLMMLAASRGTTIQIKAAGADAPIAVKALTDLVADGFYE